MGDGWKNSNNGTRNFGTILKILEDKGKTIVLDSIDFTTQQETIVNLIDATINRLVPLASEKYNVDIIAILTDNAANVTGLREAMNFVNYSCLSHCGNLLMKDYAERDDIKQILAKVHIVQTTFKKTALEALIKGKGGKAVYLKGNTRWKYQVSELENYLHNLPYLREIVNDIHIQRVSLFNVIDEIKETIRDNSFVHEIENILTILKPIAKFIDYTQRDTTTLAKGVQKYFEYDMNFFPENQVAREKQFFSKAGIVANILHPKFKGRNIMERYNAKYNYHKEHIKRQLTSEEEKQAFEDYFNDSNTFNEHDIISSKEDPANYWSLVADYHPQLAEVALLYARLPASTAELERLFSSWSYVHNKTRNRLTPERSFDMIFCYHCSRINKSLPSFSYKNLEMIDENILNEENGDGIIQNQLLYDENDEN